MVGVRHCYCRCRSHLGSNGGKGAPSPGLQLLRETRRDLPPRASTCCHATSDARRTSHKQIKALLARAFAIVNEEFSPEDHLPPHVLAFLRPIVDTTCQGFYSTTMMLLGAMAALTNGATVKLWSQKPTPLVASVFHIGTRKAGRADSLAFAKKSSTRVTMSSLTT